MRGALMVKRRRRSLKRIPTTVVLELSNMPEKKAATSELVRLCFAGKKA
jgi:hypothetical protein